MEDFQKRHHSKNVFWPVNSRFEWDNKDYSIFQIVQNNYLPVESSLQEVFCKISVLRIFAKFTGKHLCQSLYQKRYSVRGFSCEFCEVSKNTCNGCFWISFKSLRCLFSLASPNKLFWQLIFIELVWTSFTWALLTFYTTELSTFVFFVNRQLNHITSKIIAQWSVSSLRILIFNQNTTSILHVFYYLCIDNVKVQFQ